MSNLPSIPWTERERAEFKRRIAALEAGGGGGGGATDLAYTPATRLLASSTGADVTLPLVGADAGLMSSADKTKLDGIATGATANSSDATLLDRANHTGTQDASTITGSKLASFISDFASAVAALITGKQDTLVSATNIKTVNGNSLLGSGNLVISGSGGLAGTATVTPTSQSSAWRETVAAVGVTGSSKVVSSLGAFADTDENDPEFLDIGAISAVPGTDVITFILSFLTPTQGPIKINWSAF